MIDKPPWTSRKERPEAPTDTSNHRRAGQGMEGPWAKLSAMTGVLNALIAIVGVLLAYFATASQLHWPPFARPAIQRPPISSRPSPRPTPKSSNAGPTPPSNTTTPFGLMTVGTCVDFLPGVISGMTVVNCTYPHDAELDSIQKASSNNYPGAITLDNQTYSWCKSNFDQLTISAFMAQTYQGTNYTVPSSYRFIYPSATDWASGKTEEYCFFEASNGQKLNGSFLGN